MDVLIIMISDSKEEASGFPSPVPTFQATETLVRNPNNIKTAAQKQHLRRHES